MFIALILYYARKMGQIDRKSTFTKNKGTLWICKLLPISGRRDFRAVHRGLPSGPCRQHQRVLRRRR